MIIIKLIEEQLGGKLILDLFVPWEALYDNKQDLVKGWRW